MMDGSFVDTLADRMTFPVKIEVGGKERLLIPNDWSEMAPRVPKPEPIQLRTLSGLVAYIIANTDKLDLARSLIVVKDPCRVQLVGPLEGEAEEFRRPIYVVAYSAPSPAWGQYLSAEEFIVQLQANFEATPDRENLLRLLGSIREGSVRETIDDGLRQEVKTQKGVSLVNMTTVPNPVTLQPFRTFHEIEQPTSRFVVRMKAHAVTTQGIGGVGGSSVSSRPEIALFEAEGGAWERQAIARIYDYLEERLLSLPEPRPAGPSILA